MNKKVKREKWICPICVLEHLISVNKRKECKQCQKYIKLGYKEIEILRKIKEQKEIDKRTKRYSDTIEENNPTYKNFWIQRNYSTKETENQIRIRKKYCIEYWIDRGYDNPEQELNKYLDETTRERIEYWLKRGYSQKEAKEKVKEAKLWRGEHNRNNYKHINNVLRIEYWLHRGFTKEECLIKIKEEQRKRFGHLTKENYHELRIKGCETLKKDEIAYNKWIEKLVIIGYENVYNSPIFIEYWLNKGFSKEISKRKVLETKFEFRSGKYISSKIEIKCLYELELFLGRKIKNGSFRYIDGQYFCYDGKYDNFIFEFNGTHFHLDKRFYDKNDKTCYNKTFKEVKKADGIKREKTLKKYNLIIIWEHDYLNNKDLIFKQIKKFIKNETNKKGKYWDSSGIKY
jgi:hypothetical protein